MTEPIPVSYSESAKPGDKSATWFDAALGWLLTLGLRPNDERLSCDDGYGGVDESARDRVKTANDLRDRRARFAWMWLERITGLVVDRLGKHPDRIPTPVGRLRGFVDHSGLYRIAETDSTIVAFATSSELDCSTLFKAHALEGRDENRWIVEHVTLPPSLQSRGIGRSLYLSVAQRLAARGATLIPASTLKAPGCALWNSLGRDCPGLFYAGYASAASQIHQKLPELATKVAG